MSKSYYQQMRREIAYDAPQRVSAPAKLNLRLKITGRREDGYHLLSMLNVTLDLCDEMQICIRRTGGARLLLDEAARAAGLRPEENSVLKAVTLFCRAFGVENGFEITLTKRIPAGAGLGGGSSDAAAVLRFLAERYAPCSPQSSALLRRIALEIGADVPYFLHGGLAAVRGIGELVEQLPGAFLHGRPAVLLLSPRRLATPAVYARLRALSPELAAQADRPADDLCRTLRESSVEPELGYRTLCALVANDLERPAADLAPEIAPALEQLRACGRFAAGLTGSGSALFALPLSGHLLAGDLVEEVRAMTSGSALQSVAVRLLANSPN